MPKEAIQQVVHNWENLGHERTKEEKQLLVDFLAGSDGGNLPEHTAQLRERTQLLLGADPQILKSRRYYAEKKPPAKKTAPRLKPIEATIMSPQEVRDYMGGLPTEELKKRTCAELASKTSKDSSLEII